MDPENRQLLWYTLFELPNLKHFSYVIDSKTIANQSVSILLVFNNFQISEVSR